jgi:acyl-homoserine lactone synthase
MFRARKSVFVDQLKWDIPFEGEFERDQFDDEQAEYLIIADPADKAHLGSMRLLRTERPHILGSLFSDLCEDEVPTGPDIREITRLCLSRELRAAERKIIFHRLVTALVEYALLTNISAYTAVTSLHWLTQTLAIGWRCTPLSMPKKINGDILCAMMIFIEPNTINLLREAGSYQPTDLRYLNKVTAIAA